MLSNARAIEEAVITGVGMAIKRGRLPASVWGSGR